jgi:hypothetical protein
MRLETESVGDGSLAGEESLGRSLRLELLLLSLPASDHQMRVLGAVVLTHAPRPMAARQSYVLAARHDAVSQLAPDGGGKACCDTTRVRGRTSSRPASRSSSRCTGRSRLCGPTRPRCSKAWRRRLRCRTVNHRRTDPRFTRIERAPVIATASPVPRRKRPVPCIKTRKIPVPAKTGKLNRRADRKRRGARTAHDVAEMEREESATIGNEREERRATRQLQRRSLFRNRSDDCLAEWGGFEPPIRVLARITV